MNGEGKSDNLGIELSDEDWDRCRELTYSCGWIENSNKLIGSCFLISRRIAITSRHIVTAVNNMPIDHLLSICFHKYFSPIESIDISVEDFRKLVIYESRLDFCIFKLPVDVGLQGVYCPHQGSRCRGWVDISNIQDLSTACTAMSIAPVRWAEPRKLYSLGHAVEDTETGECISSSITAKGNSGSLIINPSNGKIIGITKSGISQKLWEQASPRHDFLTEKGLASGFVSSADIYKEIKDHIFEYQDLHKSNPKFTHDMEPIYNRELLFEHINYLLHDTGSKILSIDSEEGDGLRYAVSITQAVLSNQQTVIMLDGIGEHNLNNPESLLDFLDSKIAEFDLHNCHLSHDEDKDIPVISSEILRSLTEIGSQVSDFRKSCVVLFCYRLPAYKNTYLHRLLDILNHQLDANPQIRIIYAGIKDIPEKEKILSTKLRQITPAHVVDFADWVLKMSDVKGEIRSHFLKSLKEDLPKNEEYPTALLRELSMLVLKQIESSVADGDNVKPYRIAS